MDRLLLCIVGFAVVLCPSAFAQQEENVVSEDCRVQKASRELLSPGYFQAVTLYRQANHTAAVDELLRTSSETIEITIEELEDMLKGSRSRQSSPSDRCLQAAAMMHSEIEMLYAVKRNWETSDFHHQVALKLLDLVSDSETRERFRRDWLLSLAYFYQSMTAYEGEISSYVLAMTHFNEAAKRFDDDAEVLLAAGTMYELSGSLLDNDSIKDAERLYRRAIEIEPGSTIGLVRLGRVLEKRREYNASEIALRKAIDLDGDPVPSYMAYVLLGGLAERKGNLEDAIQCYKVAIEIKPRWQVAYMALGHALDESGRRKEAGDIISAAIKMDAASQEELDGWWIYERGLADRLEPLWRRLREEVGH